MNQRPDIYCPHCTKEIPTDQTFWMWQGKWYCSEKCVREVSHQTRIL